jgi:mRNA-degrading endonuclease HigB of HigAB toxin-antitoxin module
VHDVSQKALREFGRKHAGAATPLRVWLKLARYGSFQNLAELKRTFASVDLVTVKGRNFYVFDIGGKTPHSRTANIATRFLGSRSSRAS